MAKKPILNKILLGILSGILVLGGIGCDDIKATTSDPPTEILTIEDTFAECQRTEELSSQAQSTEHSAAELTSEVLPTNEEFVTEVLPTEELPTEELLTEELLTEEWTTEVLSTEILTTSAPVAERIEAKISGVHYIGDTLSAGDFTVTVWMSDGSIRKNPSGWSADVVYLAASETAITVSYEGVSTVVTVYAEEYPSKSSAIASEKEYDREAAEEAFRLQREIIQREGFSLETGGYTGRDIEWSERLYELCCQRAKEVSVHYSHDGFQGIDAAAENIAHGPDAQYVIMAWYESPGHRGNMLSGCRYGAIACYNNYWVALFAQH